MKHSFLRQISACVDWRGIRTLLNKKYTKPQNATGNPAYDALMMFKILLLQTWYGLSDYEVEERINDSLLFSEFLLLDMDLPAPDHQIALKSAPSWKDDPPERGQEGETGISLLSLKTPEFGGGKCKL